MDVRFTVRTDGQAAVIEGGQLLNDALADCISSLPPRGAGGNGPSTYWVDVARRGVVRASRQGDGRPFVSGNITLSRSVVTRWRPGTTSLRMMSRASSCLSRSFCRSWISGGHGSRPARRRLRSLCPIPTGATRPNRTDQGAPEAAGNPQPDTRATSRAQSGQAKPLPRTEWRPVSHRFSDLGPHMPPNARTCR